MLLVCVCGTSTEVRGNKITCVWHCSSALLDEIVYYKICIQSFVLSVDGASVCSTCLPACASFWPSHHMFLLRRKDNNPSTCFGTWLIEHGNILLDKFAVVFCSTPVYKIWVSLVSDLPISVCEKMMNGSFHLKGPYHCN